MATQYEDRILRALRRITRSIDLHSRQLATSYGLTGPQLICLRTLGQLGEITPGRLAREVSLSQATITGIVDRLVARQLVNRERSSVDRRQVTVSLTEAGAALVASAPSPLQERFVEQLAACDLEEQETICTTLERIVEMMGGENLEAAPVLSAEQVGLGGEPEG